MEQLFNEYAMKILQHSTTIIVLLFLIVASFFFVSKKEKDILIDLSRTTHIVFPPKKDDFYFEKFISTNIQLDTIKLTSNRTLNKVALEQCTIKLNELQTEKKPNQGIYFHLDDHMAFEEFLNLFQMYKDLQVRLPFVTIKNEVWITTVLNNYDPPSWQWQKQLELLPYE